MKPTQYIKIQEILEARIKEGIYPIDSRLPTEEKLALEFDVNRHTLRRALKYLVNLNYIKRAPKIGSIVISKSPTINKSEKIKIKYLFFDDNPDKDSKRKQIFKQICDDFIKMNPEIEIIISPIKRHGMLFSPHLPIHDDSNAIIVARVDYIADYALQGVLLPLEQFDDMAQVSSELDGRLIRHTKGIDNTPHIHALPIQMATWMMAVNVSLLKELGFSESDIPETWENFLDISTKISKLGKSKGILAFEPLLCHQGQQSITRYLPYLYSASPEGLFSESAGKLQINRKAAKDFLEWISKMYALIPNTIPHTQLFTNNKAVFRLSVAAGFIENLTKKTNFDIRAYPIPQHNTSSTPSTVMNAAFAGILSHSVNTSAKKQAAWKFVKYLSSEPAQKTAYEKLNDLPTRFDMYPHMFSKQNEATKFFDFAIKYGKKVYDYPYNTDIHRIILKAFSNAALGISSPSNAIDEAQFMLNHYAFDKTSSETEQHIQETL